MRRLKTKVHFNRVNMQRKDPRVWSAHTSHSCNMSEEVLIVHNGEVVARTVYRPEAKQPRAYIEVFGQVRNEGSRTIVEV